MSQVAVFESVKAMRAAVAGWHAAGEKVALVPTMGALHQGHIALVAEAQKHAKHVIVSIFVNPTQFAPHEDFKKYPRTFDDDCAQLVAAGPDRERLAQGRHCRFLGSHRKISCGTDADRRVCRQTSASVLELDVAAH